MLLLNFYQTPELLISESHGTSCTSRFIATSILRVPGKDYSSPKSLATNGSEVPHVARLFYLFQFREQSGSIS